MNRVVSPNPSWIILPNPLKYLCAKQGLKGWEMAREVDNRRPSPKGGSSPEDETVKETAAVIFYLALAKLCQVGGAGEGRYIT